MNQRRVPRAGRVAARSPCRIKRANGTAFRRRRRWVGTLDAATGHLTPLRGSIAGASVSAGRNPQGLAVSRNVSAARYSSEAPTDAQMSPLRVRMGADPD